MMAAACSRVRMPVGSKAPFVGTLEHAERGHDFRGLGVSDPLPSTKSLLAAEATTTIIPMSMTAARARLRARLRFLI